MHFVDLAEGHTFGFGWVLWHINHCRLFNTKSIFMQIVLFQTIQFNMSTQFNSSIYITIHFSVSTVSMSKTILFQTIQFSISTKFKCNYIV